jgi:hypothetical protein
MATPHLTRYQIAQVSGLVAEYITAQREKYVRRAILLTARQKAKVAGFFSAQVLDGGRLFVLVRWRNLTTPGNCDGACNSQSMPGGNGQSGFGMSSFSSQNESQENQHE